MSRFLIVLTILLGALRAQAQDKPQPLHHAVAVIARNAGESVRLRWAPTTHYAWRECNKSGYSVVRYTFMRDGKLLPPEEAGKGILLTGKPVRLLDDNNAWKKLMDQDDFAAVAAQALFGDRFETAVEKEQKEQQGIVAQLYETEQRFGFALSAADHSWPTAVAMGLAFEDRSTRKNETYLYRVFPAFPAYLPIDTGVVAVNMTEIYQLPKPVELTARFGDHQAFLTWNGSIFSNFYVSYNVERSNDGSNWTRLNEKPFVTIAPENEDPEKPRMELFIDSLPENNLLYYYRISGNSSFGETGPVSDPIQGIGVDPVPAVYPELTGITPTDKKGFALSWDFLAANESKITGFKVLRSDNDKGPYTAVSGAKLLPATARSFTDENPLSVNFYKIAAYDKLKREMASFSVMSELEDATPPAVPVNVRGRILKDGTLVLTWDDNTERDLLGYRVFMANNPQHDFVQETRDVRRKAYYLDTVTLATLSDKLYFRVMAEDMHNNQSALSEIATVTRPDTIAPSAPVFDEYEAGTAGIQLRWANSSSTDLVEQHLQRRRTDSPDGKDWETIYLQKIRNGESYHSYFDTSGEPGVAYYYRVEAVDDGGLRSYSKSLQSTRIDDMVRAGVEKLEAVADRENRLVLISWQYPRKTGIRDFVVYRSVAGGPAVTYSSAEPKVMEERGKKRKSYVFAYADSGVKMNTSYQYQVRVRYENGAFSPLSAPVLIQY